MASRRRRLTAPTAGTEVESADRSAATDRFGSHRATQKRYRLRSFVLPRERGDPTAHVERMQKTTERSHHAVGADGWTRPTRDADPAGRNVTAIYVGRQPGRVEGVCAPT
jgi:hypothetical protein